MTDEEYDQLKKELRKKGSKVTAQARFSAMLSIGIHAMVHACAGAHSRRQGIHLVNGNRCTPGGSRGLSCAW